jgi:hypothetical protein
MSTGVYVWTNAAISIMKMINGDWDRPIFFQIPRQYSSALRRQLIINQTASTDLINKNINRYRVSCSRYRYRDAFRQYGRNAVLIKFMKNDIGLSAKTLWLDEFDGLENRKGCLTRHL